jgi:hypothetical protein
MCLASGYYFNELFWVKYFMSFYVPLSTLTPLQAFWHVRGCNWNCAMCLFYDTEICVSIDTIKESNNLGTLLPFRYFNCFLLYERHDPQLYFCSRLQFVLAVHVLHVLFSQVAKGCEIRWLRRPTFWATATNAANTIMADMPQTRCNRSASVAFAM